MTTGNVIAPHTGRPRGPRQTMVPVKMTPAERARFKVACAEEGNLSYAEMIVKWLDDRDRRRAAAQRAQAHPLHQPVAKSHYPGGGVR